MILLGDINDIYIYTVYSNYSTRVQYTVTVALYDGDHF